MCNEDADVGAVLVGTVVEVVAIFLSLGALLVEGMIGIEKGAISSFLVEFRRGLKCTTSWDSSNAISALAACPRETGVFQ